MVSEASSVTYSRVSGELLVAFLMQSLPRSRMDFPELVKEQIRSLLEGDAFLAGMLRLPG